MAPLVMPSWPKIAAIERSKISSSNRSDTVKSAGPAITTTSATECEAAPRDTQATTYQVNNGLEEKIDVKSNSAHQYVLNQKNRRKKRQDEPAFMALHRRGNYLPAGTSAGAAADAEADAFFIFFAFFTFLATGADASADAMVDAIAEDEAIAIGADAAAGAAGAAAKAEAANKVAIRVAMILDTVIPLMVEENVDSHESEPITPSNSDQLTSLLKINGK